MEIVQIRPIKEQGLKSTRIPPTAVGGLFKSAYRQPLFESDAARGERSRILDNSLELRAKRRGSLRDCFRRVDLNNLPTAVGGIRKVIKALPVGRT